MNDSHEYLSDSGRRRIWKVHFVGIGGSGMCGLAQVLHNLGYTVSGSDLYETNSTLFLQQLGIRVFVGHHASNIDRTDVVVVSTAIPKNNPEIVLARSMRIPVLLRAEMLAELMRYRHGIAVAGTHGKTTTTSMIASILGHAGLDPTFIVGGRLNAIGSHAKLGEGRILVAEADESDASFMHLQPMVSVITNIDRDHMSTYGGDMEELYATFLRFLHNLPFYGVGILCIDDPAVRNLMPRINRRIITFGESEDADVRAENTAQEGPFSIFNIYDSRNGESHTIHMQMPGTHNIQNALAAYCVTREENVDFPTIVQGLRHFSGVNRRFHVYGELDIADGSALLIDDYGHHPTEIRATIKTLRKGWPERRLVMIFQPHRYSRLFELYDDFVCVLSDVDTLFLLGVYSAGEQIIAGMNSESLGCSIMQQRKVDTVMVIKNEDVESLLPTVLQDGDILITQGAGDIGRLAKRLSRANLKTMHQEKVYSYAE